MPHLPRPLWLALSLALALVPVLVPARALAGPELPPIEWQTKVNALLEGKIDQDSLYEFTGKIPEQCLALDAADPLSDQLCEWHLGKEHSGWKPLARALKTRARISLICRIPSDAAASRKNACSARPQHSNRRMFSPNQFKLDRQRALKTAKKRRANEFDQRGMMDKEIRASLRPIAMSWLNAARDLEELSRLIGELPSLCRKRGENMQTCVWRTSSSTYGHGTIAASIPISGSKKVDLLCTLPLDGSFRRSGETCERKPES